MDTNTVDFKDTLIIDQVLKALGKIDDAIGVEDPNHGPSVAWLAQTIIRHALQRARELQVESDQMKKALRNFNAVVGEANTEMLGFIRAKSETGVPSATLENAVAVLRILGRGTSGLARDLEGISFCD